MPELSKLKMKMKRCDWSKRGRNWQRSRIHVDSEFAEHHHQRRWYAVQKAIYSFAKIAWWILFFSSSILSNAI